MLRVTDAAALFEGGFYGSVCSGTVVDTLHASRKQRLLAFKGLVRDPDPYHLISSLALLLV